jgi:hypothetical protein
VITNIIVLSAIVFAVALFVAWLARPDLRARIERPKYRFQANVQSYDHVRGGGSGSKEGANWHE